MSEKWFDIKIVEKDKPAVTSEVIGTVDADRLKFWVQEHLNVDSETFDLFFDGTSLNANPNKTLNELGIVEGSEVLLVHLTPEEEQAFREVRKQRRLAFIAKMEAQQQQEEEAGQSQEKAPSNDDE